jgi:hypothetical protein
MSEVVDNPPPEVEVSPSNQEPPVANEGNVPDFETPIGILYYYSKNV